MQANRMGSSITGLTTGYNACQAKHASKKKLAIHAKSCWNLGKCSKLHGITSYRTAQTSKSHPASQCSLFIIHTPVSITMSATYAALCGLLLLLASSVHADSVVAVSGSKHFDQVLSENDFVVAEFYAPWYETLYRRPTQQITAAADLTA